jgi:hypothetical protein
LEKAAETVVRGGGRAKIREYKSEARRARKSEDVLVGLVGIRKKRALEKALEFFLATAWPRFLPPRYIFIH